MHKYCQCTSMNKLPIFLVIQKKFKRFVHHCSSIRGVMTRVYNERKFSFLFCKLFCKNEAKIFTKTIGSTPVFCLLWRIFAKILYFSWANEMRNYREKCEIFFSLQSLVKTFQFYVHVTVMLIRPSVHPLYFNIWPTTHPTYCNIWPTAHPTYSAAHFIMHI